MLTPVNPTTQAGRHTRSAFLDPYVAYARSITECPPLYHQAVALALVSAVVGRSVRVAAHGTYLTPNLWLILLGGPGGLKSTALDVGSRVAGSLLADRLLPGSFSPEALIDLLKDRPDRVLWRSELALLLNLLTRDYMAWCRDLLCELFDAPPSVSRKTRAGALITVPDPSLSLCGGLTPAAFREHVKEVAIYGGLMTRFVYLPADPGSITAESVTVDPAEEARIRDGLTRIATMGLDRPIRLDPGAQRLYQDWVAGHHAWMSAKPETLAALSIRYRGLPLKLAPLLLLDRLAARGMPALESIPEIVMRDACAVSKTWLELLPVAFQSYDESFYDGQKNKVLSAIKRLRPDATHTMVLRYSHLNSRDFGLVVSTMIQAGEIQATRYRSQNGHDAVRYDLNGVHPGTA